MANAAHFLDIFKYLYVAVICARKEHAIQLRLIATWNRFNHKMMAAKSLFHYQLAL